MIFERYQEHPLFKPVILAVVFHIIFIITAMMIHFPEIADMAQKATLAFHVKTVEFSQNIPQQKGSVNKKGLHNALRFVSDGPDDVKALKDVPIQSLKDPEEPVKDDRKELPLKKIDLSDPKAIARPRMEDMIFSTEEKHLRETVGPGQKHISNVPTELIKAKSATAEAGNDQNGFLQAIQKPLAGLRFYALESMNVDPEEGMPGFTPTGHQMSGFGLANIQEGLGMLESREAIVKYEALDAFLDIHVETYEDPADHEKYYRVKIFAKNLGKSFRVMPKEILFAVDASLSISPDRLEEFKKGIRYCLTNLNKGDLFNIIAFKDKPVFFSPASIEATPETVKNAETFVGSLTSSEQTDVYAAFQKIIAQPFVRTPSDVILISDGRPTHGVVDSRELINSVTRINGKKRPIFAFSGGAKVNRYLLDFTSYQNRAWSQFVKKTSDIDKGLADFYKKIKDPIFINLRYRMNGLDEKEVFPHWLPDFYQGAEFTLFGKYKNENDFSMQLLGDVDGKTKELIFSNALATSKKGGEDIMKGYAFNKIYYLISRVTVEGAKPELMKEISELSRRYGITTPYSPELDKKD